MCTGLLAPEGVVNAPRFLIISSADYESRFCATGGIEKGLCLTITIFSSYIPAVVDHRGGMPCMGTFLLHQVGSLNLPTSKLAPPPQKLHSPVPTDCSLSWYAAGHPETNNCDTVA